MLLRGETVLRGDEDEDVDEHEVSSQFSIRSEVSAGIRASLKFVGFNPMHVTNTHMSPSALHRDTAVEMGEGGFNIEQHFDSAQLSTFHSAQMKPPPAPNRQKHLQLRQTHLEPSRMHQFRSGSSFGGGPITVLRARSDINRRCNSVSVRTTPEQIEGCESHINGGGGGGGSSSCSSRSSNVVDSTSSSNIGTKHVVTQNQMSPFINFGLFEDEEEDEEDDGILA